MAAAAMRFYVGCVLCVCVFSARGRMSELVPPGSLRRDEKQHLGPKITREQERRGGGRGVEAGREERKL